MKNMSIYKIRFEAKIDTDQINFMALARLEPWSPELKFTALGTVLDPLRSRFEPHHSNIPM